MKNRIVLFFIAIAAHISGATAQQHATEIPKLVVIITIDQLRGDYLQYFTPTFGERGFKRLLNEGLVYHRMQYDFRTVSQSSAIATLHTGAYPFRHGIAADKKYDFERELEVSVVNDTSYIGNYTSDNLSPRALLSSNIADELKIASEGKSDVYSVAPDAQGALLSAGHYANAAFWLDDYNGKWATTTYYKEIPWYVDRYNMSEAPGNHSEALWTPALTACHAFPYTKNKTPFKYVFNKGDKNKYLKIKESPLINAEITSFVSKFFEYADLGKRTTPDLLAITYFAGSYKDKGYDEYSYEIQDLYFRLDKEIERLLNLIDGSVGMKNALVVLTSTGYFESTTPSYSNFKPSGEFYPDRCTALLNMYLMAIYGQANWVKGFYNNQIYLNRKYIEDQKIDWSTILQQAADFVSLFTGVQDVTTSNEYLYDESVSDRNIFRRGMVKKISGDIFLELQPG